MKRIGTEKDPSSTTTACGLTKKMTQAKLEEMERLARQCAHAEAFPFGQEQREKVDALMNQAVERRYLSRLDKLPIMNNLAALKSVWDTICLFRLDSVSLSPDSVKKVLSELAIYASSVYSVFVIVSKERMKSRGTWYFGVRCVSKLECSRVKTYMKGLLDRVARQSGTGRFKSVPDVARVLNRLTVDSLHEIGSISGVPREPLAGTELEASVSSNTGDTFVLLMAEVVKPEEKDNLREQYQRLIDIVSTKPEEVTQTSDVQDMTSKTVEEFFEHCRTETTSVTEETSHCVEKKEGLVDTLLTSARENGGMFTRKNISAMVTGSFGKKTTFCVQGAVVGAAVGTVAGILSAPLTVPVGAFLFGVTGFSLAGMLKGSTKETTTTTQGYETGSAEAQTTGESHAETEGQTVSTGIRVKWGITDERAKNAADALKTQKSRLDKGAEVWRWGAYVFAPSMGASGGLGEMKQVMEAKPECGINRPATSIWNSGNPRRQPLANILAMCEHPLFALSSDGAIKESNVAIVTTDELAKLMPMGRN